MEPRTFVIGDVHGCLTELQMLLDSLSITPKDHVIFVGDLIHKGPDSIGVLTFVRTLQDFCKVSLVAGNHEEKQLRWMNNNKKSQLSGRANPMKVSEEYKTIADALTNDLIALLENSRLYVEAEGFLMLHGGLCDNANVTPVTLKELAALKGSDRERAKWILFTRYVSPAGTPVSLGLESEGDHYWADVYDGWAGPIIYGHQPYLDGGAMHFMHAIGVDTGCVFGNRLTALEIRDSKIVNEFSITALKKYATAYMEE